MGLRGGKVIRLTDFFGLNTFASPENLAPGWLNASNNVVITNDGSPEVLRSPANFNNALNTSNPVQSAFDYDKNSGNLILFDVLQSGSVSTYSTTGTTNTFVRGNQASARWKRLTINDMAYGLNGMEMMQTDGTSVYSIGISSQSAIPTLTYSSGGTGSLAVGVTGSYAYRNSTTKHISQPSPASANSGPSSTNLTLGMAVTASTQTGVDGIVVFWTADGGSVRYLMVDNTGEPVVYSNSTTTLSITLSSVAAIDTLTPETSYNGIPPTNAFFMFKWKDRICLCDFRGATTRQQIQYNVFENCYYGIPWESWWALNIINIPNKGDAARSGIQTPLGALILAEQDAYLILGELTDKVSGPEAGISVTEHMQPLHWSIGTRSPYTVKSTPFGEIWLDQNKRIQLWDHNAFPAEIGLPIRTSLQTIQDTDAARNMAEAEWFQHGNRGGVYVLSASTTGSTNDKLFIIGIYRDPETNQLKFAAAISDITAQCVVVADVSGAKRLFIGATDRLREIFDPTTQGAGWSSSQTRFFSTVVGAEDEFAYWHSIRFDTSSIVGLAVTIANLDGTEAETIELEKDLEGVGPYYGLLDSYGYRKVVKFTWTSDDTAQRIIKNLRIAYAPSRRLI